ncbi:MAG TPA: hypothetical protein VK040_04885 [Balneolaceae bacterium]|nr:hypothetical protein [Balneolaceae bacterium]
MKGAEEGGVMLPIAANASNGRESKEMSSNYPETGSGTDLLRQVLIGDQLVEEEVEYNLTGPYQ